MYSPNEYLRRNSRDEMVYYCVYKYKRERGGGWRREWGEKEVEVNTYKYVPTSRPTSTIIIIHTYYIPSLSYVD